MKRKKRDDYTVRIGEWNFSVSGNTAYVHHANHPGDIHVTATNKKLLVRVFNDELTKEVESIVIRHETLGPKVR